MSYLSNRGQRGAILLIVLLVIAAASIATLQTMRAVRVDVASSGAFTGSIRAQALALSVEKIAKQVLARDIPDVDHLQEGWNALPDTLKQLNAVLVTGEVEGLLVDQGSKFPLKMLGTHDEAAIRVFSRLAMDAGIEQDTEMMAKALIDWQDEDTITDDEQDESLWYFDTSDSPIPNRSVHAMGELALLRWPGQNREAYLQEIGDVGRGEGLAELLTIYGTGVNLATADERVLRAMPPDAGRGEAFANAVLSARSAQNLGLDWYEGLVEEYGIDISVTPAGKWFVLDASARCGASEAKITSVLERKTMGKVRVAYRCVR